MHELFGAGTAAVVAPVDRILHKQADNTMDEVFIPTMKQENSVMTRFADAINDIQVRPYFTITLYRVTVRRRFPSRLAA